MSNMLHKPIYERYETSNIKDTKKQKSRIFQNILVNSSANRKAKCLKGLNLKLKLDVASNDVKWFLYHFNPCGPLLNYTYIFKNFYETLGKCSVSLLIVC